MQYIRSCVLMRRSYIDLESFKSFWLMSAVINNTTIRVHVEEHTSLCLPSSVRPKQLSTFFNGRTVIRWRRDCHLLLQEVVYELPRTPNETLVSGTHTQITRHKAAHHGVLVHCCPCDITIPHRTTPFSRGDNTLQRKATAALDWYRCTI
jgi:hypothetical protein